MIFPFHWLRGTSALSRRFRQHDRGGVAITFGLALIPVMLSVGSAIDYGYASMVRSKLNAAADAAALAAVNKSGLAMTKSAAEDAALNMFSADGGVIDRTNLGKVTAKVTDAARQRTIVVSYVATVQTAFMKIAGFRTITISGSSSAASQLPTYIDFYLLLDNTPSMGVGATTADIDTLVANTPDKCAFACHDLSTTPNDYYGLAKRLGVQTRIDVVRQATQKLMDTAAATQVSPSQFRMAIYTFGASAQAKGLTTVQSLTSDLSGAKTAASRIDLMTVPYQNYASDTDTNFGDVLPALNNAIPNPGNGTSSRPQKYLFFVSDGVADRALGSPACSRPTSAGADPQTGNAYTRCQEPLDVSFCTDMKNRGIKIAVLYTTYLPLPTNSWYNSWIAPFSSTIATNMQDCASPGLYFEVSPTQGISEAMTALFQKAIQQARLTK